MFSVFFQVDAIAEVAWRVFAHAVVYVLYVGTMGAETAHAVCVVHGEIPQIHDEDDTTQEQCHGKFDDVLEWGS